MRRLDTVRILNYTSQVCKSHLTASALNDYFFFSYSNFTFIDLKH